MTRLRFLSDWVFGARARFAVVVMVVATVFIPFIPAFAADPPDVEEIPGRYLLIVETSSSMRRRMENTHTAIEKLLFTGMNGQLHNSDDIGVWTFNESLYTGRFPLQKWADEKRQNITSSVSDFLRTQPYEKEGRLSAVLPDLARVVAESRRITVVLVTSGETQMSGTPFDGKINYSYEQSRDVLQKQRTPFVTVLRAQHGRLTGCSVSWSPWPVEFPAFPPEPLLVENKKEDAKALPQSTVKAETHKPKSLIIIGKKPEPVSPVPAAPAEEQKEPATTPATVPPSEVVASSSVQPVELSTSQKETEPQSAEASAQIQPPVPVEAVVSRPEPSPVAPAKQDEKSEEPKASVAEKSVKPPEMALAQPVKQAPPIPEPQTASKAPSPPAESPEPVVIEKQMQQPIQVAATVPLEAKSNRTLLLLIGGAALIGAFILAFLLMRKQRTNASLITRSMDQDKNG